MFQSEGDFCINFNPSFDFRVSFAASDTVAIENKTLFIYFELLYKI